MTAPGHDASLEPVVTQLASVNIPPEWCVYRDSAALEQHLTVLSRRSLPGFRFRQLGLSRAQQPIWGYEIGRGARTVSITAGCHADEPVGPLTAQALPDLLTQCAPDLMENFTFRVVSQMNPDGAERNRAWFSNPPDFAAWLQHAVREGPGDDIEFGFAEDPEARPECRAAIPYLWADPVAAHFSLHGMTWAEGVWYLINAPWAPRAGALMDALTDLCRCHRLPRMDIDRKGEKGFTRIREGFSTTPHSAAMKQYFLERGDPATAEKFRPSSMERAMAAGGDPLCMVSEIPLFLLQMPADLQDPVIYRFQRALDAARHSSEPDAITRVMEEFRLRPLPLEQQVSIQFAMIVLALRYVLANAR